MNASLIKGHSMQHGNLNNLPYLAPKVAVSYALQEFRNRHKESCTTLASVNAAFMSSNRMWARMMIRKARIMRDNGELQG